MPKLILSVDDKILDEINIDKDTVTIGRRTDNDICIDNLAISGYHSQITTVLNDSFLEDLNSTNGTFVNSKIVKKHALKDGDIIDIGNHRIKYINHLSSSSANSDFEKTVVMAPNYNEKKIDDSIDDLEKEISELTDTKNDPNVESDDKEKPIALIDAIYDGSEDTSLKVPSIDMSASSEPEPKKEEPATEDKPSKKSSAELPAIELPEPVESAPEKPTAEKPVSDSVSDANKIGRIQILSGSNCGKELKLDKTLTTLGKPDIAVIGITKRSSGYFIVHIDGKKDNPSKLNGETIKGKAQPLDDHDIIDVAGIKLEFFVE